MQRSAVQEKILGIIGGFADAAPGSRSDIAGGGGVVEIRHAKHTARDGGCAGVGVGAGERQRSRARFGETELAASVLAGGPLHRTAAGDRSGIGAFKSIRIERTALVAEVYPLGAVQIHEIPQLQRAAIKAKGGSGGVRAKVRCPNDV